MELREEELPSQEAWKTAGDRASKVFGLTVSPLRNAANASDFAERLGQAAAEQAAACGELVERLAAIGADFSIAEDGAKRLRTARATRALVQALSALRGKARVEKLAEIQPDTSLEAMGTSFRKADDVLEVLRRTHWKLFATLSELADDRADAAQLLLQELVEVMAADEYAVALGHRLPEIENRTVNLLARPVPAEPPPPSPSLPPGKGKGTGGGGTSVREGVLVDQGAHGDLNHERLREVTARLEALLRKEPAARLEITWKLLRDRKDGA